MCDVDMCASPPHSFAFAFVFLPWLRYAFYCCFIIKFEVLGVRFVLMTKFETSINLNCSCAIISALPFFRQPTCQCGVLMWLGGHGIRVLG